MTAATRSFIDISLDLCAFSFIEDGITPRYGNFWRRRTLDVYLPRTSLSASVVLVLRPTVLAVDSLLLNFASRLLVLKVDRQLGLLCEVLQ